MKCKYCGNEVEADSVFCRFCGERLARVRRTEKRKKPSAPKPHQLATGEWTAQVMINGRRQSVKGETEADYYAKAEALKAGILTARPAYMPLTVGQMVDAYIERNRPVLSPSTIKGYKSVRKHRFQAAMKKDVHEPIDWQMEINAELLEVGSKTLANAWRLITAAIRDAGIDVPRVKLPQIPKRDRPWLDYEQVSAFLAELYDTWPACAVPALLALHGLRRSEITALTRDDIDMERETILVRGAEVYGESGKLVKKSTNKSRAGSRTVPIMIPQLLPELKKVKKGEKIVKASPNSAYVQINRLCRAAGLPEVGLHGLRHSFASLAYHLGWSEATTQQLGGWTDLRTVHEVYTHLSALDKDKDVKRMKDWYFGEDESGK